MQAKIWRVVRWLFGAFYLISGAQFALVLAGVLPKPDFVVSDASAAFQNALAATGFVIPLLFLTYIVSGALLLRERTAPLGIVMLAPVMVIIFFTNTMLDRAWIWGGANALILAALAWQFRSAFIPLWNYPAERR